MSQLFWSDDLYAGDVRLRVRFVQDEGDPNDRLTVDATWPDGGTRRITRIMDSTYRTTHGLASALIVAHASCERIADQIRLGLFRPKERPDGHR